jgi:hypothetical protein
MKRIELLWLAFEKFAIVLSFFVSLAIILTLVLVGYTFRQQRVALSALRDDVACPMVLDVNALLDNLEDAVITRTVPVDLSVPMAFTLDLDSNTSVQMNEGVPLNSQATLTLPAGGGQLRGSVGLELPKGTSLPIHLEMPVPISHTIPVQTSVHVAIPIKDTELGPVVGDLRGLLAPYLSLLDDTLNCTARPDIKSRAGR